MAVKSLKRAQERIEIKDLKLNALLDVSLAINSNVAKEKLFAIYEDVLLALNIEKVLLLTAENEWKPTLSIGVQEGEVAEDLLDHLGDMKDITEVSTRQEGPFKFFDTIIPVYHKKKPLAYLLIGDVVNEAIKISPIIKHFPFIQTFTNIIVVALENKTLAKNALKQEGVRKELELASEMQSMLLPRNFKHNDLVKIAAHYQSHQEVGGDYYDVMFIDEHRVVFCIADVSGKGMSAAILMSNFQANVRVLSQYANSLEELVVTLNDKVVQSAKGERFITMFIGLYDARTHHLKYINCGHNPPVLKSGNEIKLLNKGCPGLGMLDEMPFITVGEEQIHPASILTCFTDGLVEVENEALEEFGGERVSKLIQAYSKDNVEELNQELLSALAEFKKKQPYVDDIAILSCYFC